MRSTPPWGRCSPRSSPSRCSPGWVPAGTCWWREAAQEPDAAGLLRAGAHRKAVGRAADRAADGPADGPAATLHAIDVSFGDAAQVFHIGPASCGVYGAPAGVCAAVARWGTAPLEELAAPAGAVGAGGRAAQRRAGIRGGDPRRPADLDAGVRGAVGAGGPCAAGGRAAAQPRAGRCALCASAGTGAEPFYEGDVAAAVMRLAVGARWLG